jgi:hypothetical protein
MGQRRVEGYHEDLLLLEESSDSPLHASKAGIDLLPLFILLHTLKRGDEMGVG